MLKLSPAYDWFESLGWQPFDFQKRMWQAYAEGKSGLLNAPTGSGKTYALFLPMGCEGLEQNNTIGLQAIWITPIRALSKEIKHSAEWFIEAMDLDWEVAIRTGDTPTKERQKQKEKPPQLLITTPESLHLLLAQKGYPDFFKNLKTIVIDEWHELLGTKRGLLVELALSRFKTLLPNLRIWGISATIGNLGEAMDILLGMDKSDRPHTIIKSDIEKRVEVVSILPDSIEEMPWAGHLGIKLLEKILPVLEQSKSTLIFTNTRSQAEIWYQRLLKAMPQLAGQMAMHHGSIERELRNWVEDALHEGKLKAVVATSSLDLGVDFRPVESVIQIGGPKGVARFLQRAGRSGHQPNAISRIYFVPTHSLELIEAAAIRKAIDQKFVESRIPYIRSFDVLVQYLVTLAISEGFRPEEIWPEIKNTYAFHGIEEDEWQWCLNFITTGGDSLYAYDEYHKVVVENGIYKVTSKKVAMRHRLSIGTIVGDAVMRVKYLSGKRLGTIEEWFISKLNPGDVFWFGGKNLELFMIKNMEVLVKRSKKRSGKIPSWQGGRMPLSAQLGEMLRDKLSEAAHGNPTDIELQTLQPLLEIQAQRSHLPKLDELLIEVYEDRDGYHLFVFPFEGRFVHEGLAGLLAFRLSQLQPFSFSLAFNDYGFELLSDQPIRIDAILDNNLFTTDHLYDDLQNSLNSTEMARRRFRDIGTIAGLIFRGYPGKYKAGKHLQSSTQLIFNVFCDYDPDNLLLKQAYQEVMDFQLEEQRMRAALNRIAGQKLIVKYPEKPSPFSFPIMVDRLRERFTTEQLEDRIERMQVNWG